MANLNRLESIYKMETTDARTGITTVWFLIKAPGFECTDLYVGLSKNGGEWLSASGSFYDLSIAKRDAALAECRALLQKMG